MLDTSAHKIPYPSKKIVLDLLTREGPPDLDSFSPFEGKAHIFRNQFKDNYSEINPEHVANMREDFEPSRVNINQEDLDVLGESLSANLVTLESVDDSQIEQYLANVCAAYKIDRKGGAIQKSKDVKQSNSFYDDEAGSYKSESDLSVQRQEFSNRELLQAKARLPYYIKMLHEGSKIYRVSLLSFIGAAEKVRSTRMHSGMVAGPQAILSNGAFETDANGDFMRKCTESDNSRDSIRNIISWTDFGQSTVAPVYTTIYKELLSVCGKLGISLGDEDFRELTNDKVLRMKCNYIPSNWEYLSTCTGLDDAIFDLIKRDAVTELLPAFREKEAVADNSISALRIRTALDWSAYCTNQEIVSKQSSSSVNAILYQPNPKKVNRFLTFFATHKITPSVPVDASRFSITNRVLYDGSVPLFLDTLKLSGVKYHVPNNTLCVVADSGYLVAFKDVENMLVIDTDDFIANYNRGEAPCWRSIQRFTV